MVLPLRKKQLIETICNYQSIWQKTHSQHLKRDIVSPHWVKIAIELKVSDLGLLKKQWSNLLTYLRKCLDDMSKSGSGFDEVTDPSKWFLFQDMSFVKENYSKRLQKSKMPTMLLAQLETEDFNRLETFSLTSLLNSTISSLDRPLSPAISPSLHSSPYSPATSSQTSSLFVDSPYSFVFLSSVAGSPCSPGTTSSTPSSDGFRLPLRKKRNTSNSLKHSLLKAIDCCKEPNDDSIITCLINYVQGLKKLIEPLMPNELLNLQQHINNFFLSQDN